MESPSIQSLDDPDQLVSSIAVLAREERELARLSDDGPMFGARRDRDAAPSAELEQPLVARSCLSARRTVFRLTSRTAARSRAANGGGIYELELGR
jgi:hypothetical protein